MKIITNYEGMLRLENEYQVERVSAEEILSDWRPAEQAVLVVDVDAAEGVYSPRRIKATGTLAPVIGITHELNDGEWTEHKALFLEQGGDYLLREPVNPRELHACIIALGRRFGAGRSILALYDRRLVANTLSAEVSFDGERIHLTGKERDTLFALARRFNTVISKEGLLDALYSQGVDDEPELRIIDVFICKLRGKLNRCEEGLGSVIETVWGQGYRLHDVVPEEVLAEGAS